MPATVIGVKTQGVHARAHAFRIASAQGKTFAVLDGMRILAAVLLAGWSTVATAQSADAPVVSEILAAQILLDRAGFSPGELDGRAGANLKRALLAFQRAHALPATGQVDEPTWARLSEDATTAPLVSYTLTEADVAGPFVPDIPDDLMAQAKLKTLGYRTALEAIAEKFHASPRLLQELNPSARFRAGEQILVPNVEPFTVPAKEVRQDTRRRGATPRARGTSGATEPAQAVTIAVTKSTSSLTVEDASGRVLFHAPVTSGSEHDPLPLGNWKVTTVQRLPVFNYNPDLFWDANPKHSKARIAPGPNNPVGIVWIDLSKEHYGIHGTPEPSKIGHVQSHGCVRLTNWDAARLLTWVNAGTAVIFRE